MNNLEMKRQFKKDDFRFVGNKYCTYVEGTSQLSNSYIKSFLRELKSNKLAMFSLVILIIVLLASALAFIAPYDPDNINVVARLKKPSWNHFFGTDELGRDYFTRMLYGGRISLMVGFSSMIVSITIGTFVGTLSGFKGGIVDKVIMRAIDVLMCIPTFFLILIFNTYMKPSIKNVVIVIGIFGWMGIARIVRAETLSYKEREYVKAGRCLGAYDFQLILKHIIPNVMPTVIVASTINIAGAILTESALSFLGLGVQAPTSSWGSMLQTAQNYLDNSIYIALFPGMAILLTVLSFNIIGDTLRIALERE